MKLHFLPCALLTGLALLHVPAAAHGQSGAEDNRARAQAVGERLDTTRGMLAQWLETRKLIAQEKRDWALGKELLQDRIEMLKAEIAKNEKAIVEEEEKLTGEDKEQIKLEAEGKALDASFEKLTEVVVGFEDRTRSLLKRLPAPASAKVESMAQSIPKDSSKTKQLLSNRFILVMAILKELAKFNQEISLHSELRDLPDGTQVSVNTIYVGLGRGFYVTEKLDHAGIGTATKDGWVWEERNDAAEAIHRAVLILQGKEIADFVQLPFATR